jgi:pimeloyl-ACP methyl ester carboxylesterase
MPVYYPIVYVRGYAFSDGELEETTDDPTNGFNIGTTHARQSQGEQPIKYRFPGPFVRLMTDHGYRDVMNKGVDSLEGLKDKRKTLWIHRFYEPYSDTFGKRGKPGRPSIEQAAIELKELIDRILKECFEATETDRKVILIAHSMGGLVCRSLIQRVLEIPPHTVIEKVVTYGTPHGGIPGSSSLIRFHGLGNFSRKALFRCLAPKDAVYSKEFDPQQLTKFPADRFLCVIGTNHSDYEAVYGLSRAAFGAGSDGLVIVERAWVKDAPRVYVHRSHSGRYGLVSSAEAFHAVERFLFGGFRAAVRVQGGGGGDSPSSPDTDGGPGNYQIAFLDADCTIKLQGLRISNRKADHMSAMRLISFQDPAVRRKPEQKSLCVFYFFSSGDHSDLDSGEYHFAISFSIRVDRYEDGGLVRSEVGMLQSLKVWVVVEKQETPEKARFNIRYRWLGDDEVRESTVDNLTIAVPTRNFSETWNQGALSLVLELAKVDADTSGGSEGRRGPDEGGDAGGEQTPPKEQESVRHDYAYALGETGILV